MFFQTCSSSLVSRMLTCAPDLLSRCFPFFYSSTHCQLLLWSPVAELSFTGSWVLNYMPSFSIPEYFLGVAGWWLGGTLSYFYIWMWWHFNSWVFSGIDVQWLLIECGGLGPVALWVMCPRPPIRANQNRCVDSLSEHAECLSMLQGPVECMMDL